MATHNPKLAPPTPRAAGALPYPASADGHLCFPQKPVVLYVDDEEQNLVSFRIGFKRDFTIHVARSATEALEVLAQQPIELLVTDQRMPDMTGVALLEKVVALYPDTMRMIITGYSDIGVVIDAINAGHVYRYLRKPWDHHELLRAMQSAVRFYRLSLERRHLLEHLETLVAKRTEELEAKNASLSEAMEELTATQQQLVATEKRVALGALVSNIAHEINSPGSAVLSIARYTHKKIPKLLEKLPLVLLRLSTEELGLFQELVQLAMVPRPRLTTRAERKARQKIIEQLRKANVDEALCEGIALRLVQLSVMETIGAFLPLAQRTDAEEVFLLAEEVAGLAQQTASIAEAAERILRLVRLLKNYKDIAEETAREPTDIQSTLERALDQHGHLLTHTINVRWELQPSLPPILANAEQLYLVWASLIHNAILALLPVGGGTLTIAAEAADDALLVTIADTGEGMTAEVKAKAFEPFFTTRSGGQGSGLGLDISRRIIRAHGGEITLYSENGHTRFVVHLPLTPVKN